MHDPIFHFMSRYFWVPALSLVPVNAVVMYARTRKYRQENPDLAPGYRALILWFLTFTSIPWLIMGWGITSGRNTYVWEFFNPRTGGPFTQGFFFSIVCVWLLSGYWIYLLGGAETLLKYPGLFNIPFKSVKAVRFFFGIFMVLGLGFFPFMWFNGFPVPK